MRRMQPVLWGNSRRGSGCGGRQLWRQPRHLQHGTPGVVTGRVVRARAGFLDPDKVRVNGVAITHEDGGGAFSPMPVGRSCQFAPGTAVMVSTLPMDTHSQPNATGPKGTAWS